MGTPSLRVQVRNIGRCGSVDGSLGVVKSVLEVIIFNQQSFPHQLSAQPQKAGKECALGVIDILIDFHSQL